MWRWYRSLDSLICKAGDFLQEVGKNARAFFASCLLEFKESKNFLIGSYQNYIGGRPIAWCEAQGTILLIWLCVVENMHIVCHSRMDSNDSRPEALHAHHGSKSWKTFWREKHLRQLCTSNLSNQIGFCTQIWGTQLMMTFFMSKRFSYLHICNFWSIIDWNSHDCNRLCSYPYHIQLDF